MLTQIHTRMQHYQMKQVSDMYRGKDTAGHHIPVTTIATSTPLHSNFSPTGQTPGVHTTGAVAVPKAKRAIVPAGQMLIHTNTRGGASPVLPVVGWVLPAHHERRARTRYFFIHLTLDIWMCLNTCANSLPSDGLRLHSICACGISAMAFFT